MIRVNGLQLLRGSRILLQEASLVVNPGQKVGIVGANGCGKSSLFQLLRGQLTADLGEVEIPEHWRMSWVEQETPAIDASVLQHCIDGDMVLRELERNIAACEAGEGGSELARLYHRFEEMDGYSMDARASRLLAGLGFDQTAQSRPVASFSGGWRMRINLARALIRPSDLLLLDEPTNHLDMEALVWMEQFLRSYQGTLLIISHDREFLDVLVDSIVHFDKGRLQTYRGNYSSYERQYAERLSQEQVVFEKQAQQRAHLQSFVDRFRAKATKARQAQSRLKALEKLTASAPAHAASGYKFNFFQPDALVSPLISLDRVVAGYGDTPVLKRIHLDLLPGSRIALLGRNGAGKSTLVKILAGQLAPLTGTLTAGKQLRTGYFAQHQLDALDIEASPLIHLKRLAPDKPEQGLRDYLGGFGFGGREAEAPVGPLSGGEKTRLALALLIWSRPNLLLLDEPTNHLDLEMRQALVMALQDFAGAVILVSHDRYLLKTVVDQFYTVENGVVEPYDGDLATYQNRRLQESERRAASESSAVGLETRQTDSRVRKRREAEFRQTISPLKKAVESLEKQIHGLQAEIDRIDQALGSENLYNTTSQEQFQSLLQQQGKYRSRLTDLEERWLQQQEEIEERQQAFADEFKTRL